MTVKANIPIIGGSGTDTGGLFVLPRNYTSSSSSLDLTGYMNPTRSMYSEATSSNLEDRNRYIRWTTWYGFIYSDSSGAFYTNNPFISNTYYITRNHWLPNGTEDTSAAKSDCISIFAYASPYQQHHRRISFENWGRFTIGDNHAFGPIQKFNRWTTLDLSKTTNQYPSFSEPHASVDDFDTYSMGVEAGRNKFMFEGYNRNNMTPPYTTGQSNWNVCNTSTNGLYHGHYYSSDPGGMSTTADVLSALLSNHYNNMITSWISDAQTSSISWSQSSPFNFDSTITAPRTIYTKSGAINNVQTAQIISFTPPVMNGQSSTPYVSPAPLFPGYSDFGSLYASDEVINIGYLYVRNDIVVYDTTSQTWTEIGEFYTGGPGVLAMCVQQRLPYCPSGLYIEDTDYGGQKFHMCICPAMVGLDPGLDIYHPGKGVAIKSSDNLTAHTEFVQKYGFPFSTNGSSVIHNEHYGIHIFRAGNGDKTIEEIRQNYTLNSQGSAGLSEYRTVLSNTYIP